MAAGVNLLKLFDADLGVNGRGIEFFMAEQLLDEPDVRPVFQHVRRAGVPQDVAAAFALQPGLGQPRRHHAGHDIGIERPAVASQEQRLGARVQAQTRTHGLQVMLQPVNRPCADGDNPVFFSFAEPDVQRAPLGVHVGKLDAAKLGAADARRVKHFQHGAVTDAQRIGHVRHGEQPFHFGQGQHGLGQPLFHPGQFQFTGRVVQDDIAAGQPAEEVLERAEVFALRAPAQPLAVGLGATPEPALITFEDGPGDLSGACQVTLGSPGQEHFKGIATPLQRAFRVVACAQGFQVGITPQRERVGGAAVEVIRSPVIASPLRLRALGEFFDGGKAFVSSHSYDAS